MDVARVVAETFLARAEHHATLGSTNDRASKLAEQPGAPLPLLVVADQQTAGRGRGGNGWWTGPGSLAMSLLIEPSDAAAGGRTTPLLGLAAGIAVVRAVAPLLPEQPPGIHWPNDVMVDEQKLAGVLVEVLPSGRAIVGIGLNVNNTADDAPADLCGRVATLRDLTGREHDRTALLVAVLESLETVLSTLTDSPEKLAAEADRLCLQRGRRLKLQLGRETIEGRCAGIAPDGGLVLETPQGRRTCHTGTVLP